MTYKNNRLKLIWEVIRREDGYTFALNFTFLFVTIGMVMLAMLMWFGSATAAYFSLRSATSSAAFAAQAQVSQVNTGSGVGYNSGTDWAVQSSYQEAAQSVFQAQVNNAHLNSAFTNLKCTTMVTGNKISVLVTASYLPLFLQTVSQGFPQIEALTIPMTVAANEEYKIVG